MANIRDIISGILSKVRGDDELLNPFIRENVVPPRRTGPGFTEPMQQPVPGRVQAATSGPIQRTAVADAIDLTPPKTPFDEQINDAFGKNADNFRRVLSHPAGGENKGFDPLVENRNDDGSTDRGLFQINSNTFIDFMRRKPGTLKRAGIVDFDDMFDVEKNIAMAKIIFREQGFDAWFGAPEDLRK